VLHLNDFLVNNLSCLEDWNTGFLFRCCDIILVRDTSHIHLDDLVAVSRETLWNISRHSVQLAEFPKAIVQVMNLVNANTSQDAHGKGQKPMGIEWQHSWDLWMFIHPNI
jgi:hypothetical protein